MSSFQLPIQNQLKLAITLGLGMSSQHTIAVDKKTDEKKMNIVFLLADDIRWNSIGCMGNNIIVTPNIDAIASNGIRYENAYVTTAISCVSRATLLTGQYMSRHTIDRFNKEIPMDKFVDTYPSILRNAGYFTGFVGKYGVGKIRKTDFDYVNEYEGKHWMPVNGIIESIGEDKRGKKYTRITGDSIHVTDKNANDAIEFLKNRPTNNPFCLSVSFFAPHAEDRHPQQYRNKPSSEKYYKDVVIPVPETSTIECLKALPPFIADEKSESRARWHRRFDTPEKYQKYMKSYYRLISDMDEAVGRIVAELKKQGVYENTLIVFMGDNGYLQSDHQLADKWYAYEQSIRVPLIIYDPRVPEKSRGFANKNIVLNVDIAPTLVAAAGMPVPRVMQGYDLSKTYLSKKSNAIRTDFFYEHPFILNERFIQSSQALITTTEKYIIYPHYKYEEYFNLKTDPKEVRNSFADIKNRKKIEKLKKRFELLKKLAN